MREQRKQVAVSTFIRNVFLGGSVSIRRQLALVVLGAHGVPPGVALALRATSAQLGTLAGLIPRKTPSHCSIS